MPCTYGCLMSVGHLSWNPSSIICPEKLWSSPLSNYTTEVPNKKKVRRNRIKVFVPRQYRYRTCREGIENTVVKSVRKKTMYSNETVELADQPWSVGIAKSIWYMSRISSFAFWNNEFFSKCHKLCVFMEHCGPPSQTQRLSLEMPEGQHLWGQGVTSWKQGLLYEMILQSWQNFLSHSLLPEVHVWTEQLRTTS